MRGNQKFTFAICDFCNNSWNRRAIDMHIENIQKNANAREVRAHPLHRNDFAVGGRKHQLPQGSNSFRVAKEVEAEGGQNVERKTRPGVQKVRKCQAGECQPARIVNPVNYNPQTSIFSCRRPPTLSARNRLCALNQSGSTIPLTTP